MPSDYTRIDIGPSPHVNDFERGERAFEECDCEQCVPSRYPFGDCDDPECEICTEATPEYNDDCAIGEPGCDCAQYLDEEYEVDEERIWHEDCPCSECVVITDNGHVLETDCPCEPEYEDYREYPMEARMKGEAQGYELVPMPTIDFGEATASPGEKGHYSTLRPEPIQVIQAWGLDFLAGSALKYLARYPRKGGVEDLEKVKFYADQMIAREKREGRA